MFHNIFKNKRKKNKEKKNPEIIADIHEKDSMILAELKEKNINLIIRPLKVGDYLIGNTIIERKTSNDLISSMLSKRLVEQLKNMQQYKNKLLIIEGGIELEENSKLNPNSIRGFILSIINNWETPIIFTKNPEDTADYLAVLAKQQIKTKIQMSLHSRIPKTKSEQKKYILESFPNIGPKTAEKLIKKFKNLNNVFNANEEDLKPILKSRTKNFIELIRD